jgi:bromodomain adjacent to zinc finger domain protein 1A
MDEIAQLDSKIEPEGDGVKVDSSKELPTPLDRATATPSADLSSPAPGQSEDELETKQNGNNSDGTDDLPSSSRRKRPSVLRRMSAKHVLDAPLKVVGHGKDRAQARIKAAELRSAMAERRRFDEDLNKTERRLEGIEREFRQLFGIGRTRHMGKDRFFNRYWWLDGMGIGHLITSSGAASYGTGRVFVQGPSEYDLLVIAGKGGVVQARQKEEDGSDGTLGPGEWGIYSEPQDVEELVAWLNVKGHRELALKNVLTKWLDNILSGVKRRQVVS